MFKIIRPLLLTGVLLVLLTGCNTTTIKHNYTFTGEGEVWSAEYVQKAEERFITKKDKPAEYETDKTFKFQLIFKGENSDLAQIKQLKYSYKGAGGSGSLTTEGPVQLPLLTSGGMGSGNFVREDDIIQVEVEWDGQKEQFELRVPEKE